MSPTQFTARRVTVTPNKARQWLENMSGQRRANDDAVLRYAQDMEEGLWNEDNEQCVLLFDEDGNLLDGQHRCLAVELSGCTIRMFKATVKDAAAAEFLDLALQRTAKDFMQRRGVKNASHISTISRALAIALYHNVNPFDPAAKRKKPVSRPYIMKTYDDHTEDITESLAVCGKAWKMGSALGLSIGKFATLYLLVDRDHADACRQYIYTVLSGESDGRPNPAIAVREALIKDNAARKRNPMGPTWRAAMLLLGWRSWATSRPDIPKWTMYRQGGSEFPEVYGAWVDMSGGEIEGNSDQDANE